MLRHRSAAATIVEGRRCACDGAERSPRDNRSTKDRRWSRLSIPS